MAAGLSIKKANFPQFKTAFASTIQTHLNTQIPKVGLLTDGPLEAPDISLHNAQLLFKAGPWGQGF
jgi:single-stranded-DNA-specific exonuclease